jgi:predicted branched-subunit amino acid permease
MSTVFDVVTVACFVGLVIAFFQFTDRETRTLVQFVLAGIVFAVANQVGNAGSTVLAVILIIAGAGYAAMTALRR